MPELSWKSDFFNHSILFFTRLFPGRNKNGIILILLFFLSFFFLFPFAVSARGNFTLSPSIVLAAKKKYGEDAQKRLLAWQKLIQEDTSKTDLKKLKKVNTFFNQIPFITDLKHWHKTDYWATPIEFLASNGGDCEDFALAKYFTLKAMGVSESKLNMTYVKAWKLNQAHMVLTYYRTPGSEPLVLDNLINTIEPASKRRDLLPVYSFNGTGLWLAKQRGRGHLVGKSNRLSLWNNLLHRMPTGLK